MTRTNQTVRQTANAAKCQRCGVAPAGVTHICPPPELSHGSPALAPAMSIPLMPPCPMCWRTDGTHVLGCAVESYIQQRGLS